MHKSDRHVIVSGFIHNLLSTILYPIGSYNINKIPLRPGIGLSQEVEQESAPKFTSIRCFDMLIHGKTFQEQQKGI